MTANVDVPRETNPVILVLARVAAAVEVREREAAQAAADPVDLSPLDPFEEAVLFAIQRALKRDREEAEAMEATDSEPGHGADPD